MDRLQVAVPWNNARYIPCNGFHPLYRPLFEGDSRFQYNVVDELDLVGRLTARGRDARRIKQAIRRISAPYADHVGSSVIAREFIEYLTPDEMWLTRQIPGDVEFHHTSPLTDGTRPFVLHAESFLPIFMPFAYQGRGFTRSVTEVRAFYERLFSSRNCLGIFSHMPETLDQLRSFFRNDVIAAKLFPSKIGLPDHVFQAFGDNGSKGEEGRPVFLFASSANQSPEDFALRGGIVALKVAQMHLQSGRDGKFIFCSRRPTDQYLADAGLDPEFLRTEEGSRILWLNGFLREHEQLRLFALADVLLLPSVNLHSVTIMQALAAGAIPVVTDTYGPNRFVRDGNTGIVLGGVRNAVWELDSQAGVPIDRHDRFAAMADTLARRGFKQLTPILDDSNRLRDMQTQCRVYARQHLSGVGFRRQFEEDLEKAWLDYRKQRPWPRPERNRKVDGPACTRLLGKEALTSIFESPPCPMVVVNSGYCRAVRVKGLWFSVLRREGADTLGQWSPLELSRTGLLRSGAVTVASSLDELQSELLPNLSAGWWRAPVKYWPTLVFLASRNLQKRPLLHAIARRVYRLGCSVLSWRTDRLFRA